MFLLFGALVKQHLQNLIVLRQLLTVLLNSFHCTITSGAAMPRKFKKSSMNKNKLSRPSRIIVAIASLALIATYFLPVWFIFLIAPQYPEGLTMNIWLTKLTGQVD